MKAVVAAFNEEKALVGAFSVITNLRMELFGALLARYLVDILYLSYLTETQQNKYFPAFSTAFVVIE